MAWTIDPAFETEATRAVLAFLRRANPSAHSDVAGELALAAQGAPDAHTYCPDSRRYAFVAVHLEDHTIVGLAFGMDRVAFRLPSASGADACRDGGAPCTDIGPDWVVFAAFTDEPLRESRRRLGRWCRRALAAAG
jgi:hypothetical protein